MTLINSTRSQVHLSRPFGVGGAKTIVLGSCYITPVTHGHRFTVNEYDLYVEQSKAKKNWDLNKYSKQSKTTHFENKINYIAKTKFADNSLIWRKFCFFPDVQPP